MKMSEMDQIGPYIWASGLTQLVSLTFLHVTYAGAGLSKIGVILVAVGCLD